MASTASETPAQPPPQLEQVRERWNEYAARYTETSNKRMTLQCARELHSHMQLGEAQRVLEVAAGAGLGSLDILQRMASSEPRKEKKTLLVTDLSPVMVAMARETLASVAAASETVDVQVKIANGQDLVEVATGSVNRVVSNLCLQLTPDPDALLREAKRVLAPDGLVGFTIWGQPEHSAKFTLSYDVNRELGLEVGADSRNFELGRDLPALRARFAAAGFSHVRIWSFLCVVELWSGEDFAAFHHQSFKSDDEELRKRAFDVAKRLADHFLAKGYPIGLETYLILAKA
ncbi:hypothetical protein BBJ28_00019636 [Nothophytophthora sp. Chile5]|nr:hypothetical protein BBJ28_00019636 [Nothophytophthora sp. Chile5]